MTFARLAVNLVYYHSTSWERFASMGTSDTGIPGFAGTGTYSTALAELVDEMSLLQRGNLIHLDACLHDLWGLGENVILSWCPEGDGIAVLMVPHYSVAAFTNDEAPTRRDEPPPSIGSSADAQLPPSEEFFKTLIAGRRRLTSRQMQSVATLLGIEKIDIALRTKLTESKREAQLIEQMIKRYSISYVPSRAVALFDIVGFGLLRPFEQMTQLNSLSYSLNSAQSKLTNKKIGIDFARTTTGDGFYVWNRDLTLDANINLYHFMHLALADNAIARRKARANTVPRLRACFHIGSSYEFHQAEGLNPTIYNYIVGDVTIELARMIERALPDQILVGEFRAEMPFLDDESPGWVTLDSIDFVARATHSVSALKGMELSGERVDTIKCYLTGAQLNNGEFTVRRIIVSDKHGISRMVYNSKANIYRKNADPILLGIEDRIISSEEVRQDRSEHVLRPGAT